MLRCSGNFCEIASAQSWTAPDDDRERNSLQDCIMTGSYQHQGN